MNRCSCVVLVAVMLTGCAGPLRAPEGGVRADPAALTQWSAAGRMAIAANGEGGSGSFDWAQDGGTTRLDLRGPLGTGAVRLVLTPQSFSLTDGSGQSLDAAAAQADLRTRLGADLPWEQLRYWLLGLPAPDQPASVQDATAVPWRVIDQAGWRLTYESFVDAQGYSLPQRFTAERPSVRVRVVVDRWATANGAPEASKDVP